MMQRTLLAAFLGLVAASNSTNDTTDSSTNVTSMVDTTTAAASSSDTTTAAVSSDTTNTTSSGLPAYESAKISMDATIAPTFPSVANGTCYMACWNTPTCGYSACESFASAHATAVGSGFATTVAGLSSSVAVADVSGAVEGIVTATSRRGRRSLEKTEARRLSGDSYTYTVSVTVPESATTLVVSAMNDIDADTFATDFSAAIDSAIAADTSLSSTCANSACATTVSSIDTSSIVITLLDASGNPTGSTYTVASFLSAAGVTTAAPDSDGSTSDAVKVGMSLVAVAAAFFSLF